MSLPNGSIANLIVARKSLFPTELAIALLCFEAAGPTNLGSGTQNKSRRSKAPALAGKHVAGTRWLCTKKTGAQSAGIAQGFDELLLDVCVSRGHRLQGV
jgi:hypothetical protein